MAEGDTAVMESRMAEVGDIVQVRPEAARWGGLLVVVSEVRSWGVVAYMQLPGPCEAIVTVVDTNQAWVRLSGPSST